MSKKAKKQLDKQYKLLKKSLKAELKRSRKSQAKDGDPVTALSKKEIKSLAKEMVAQLVTSNDQSNTVQVVHHIEPAPSSMSFALKPLKKSPCKRCPALAGGLCKCAVKQAEKRRERKVG